MSACGPCPKAAPLGVLDYLEPLLPPDMLPDSDTMPEMG